MRSFGPCECSILGACLATCLGTPPAPEAPVRPQFVARLTTATFQVGRPIVLATEFRNTTDRELTFWSAGYWPNHRIEVTAGDGTTPPRTAAGLRRFAAFEPAGPRDKNAPRALSPGQTLADGEQDLAALFVLTPGRYRARVVYHDASPPTPLRLVSNPVTFVVE